MWRMWRMWRMAFFSLYGLVVQRLAVFEWDLLSLWVWLFGFVVYFFLPLGTSRRVWCQYSMGCPCCAFLGGSLRFNNHALAICCCPVCILNGLFAVGFLVIPLSLLIVSSFINLLYQHWRHAELISTLGSIERWFVTRSNHRVQHGMIE